MVPAHIKNISHFPFLDLPGELQNRIYEFCLTLSSPYEYLIVKYDGLYDRKYDRIYGDVDLDVGYKDKWEVEEEEETPPAVLRVCCQEPEDMLPEEMFSSRKGITPALLLVCKQIGRDATPYLYRNMLWFNDLEVLGEFHANVGENMRFVAQIIIDSFEWPEVYEDWCPFDDAIALSKIHLPFEPYRTWTEEKSFNILEAWIVSWAQQNEKSALQSIELLAGGGWRQHVSSYHKINRRLLAGQEGKKDGTPAPHLGKAVVPQIEDVEAM